MKLNINEGNYVEMITGEVGFIYSIMRHEVTMRNVNIYYVKIKFTNDKIVDKTISSDDNLGLIFKRIGTHLFNREEALKEEIEKLKIELQINEAEIVKQRQEINAWREEYQTLCDRYKLYKLKE